ncbi:bifunctional methylenetetrahydrofolate dehydrogenase/methenyltetrahydrofolate cyclohydrolase, partial [Escherichia coli]|nr:bifunctional methylenetetrahydrofolate dehydrogenase/methenyltetrahydrofolate cyclohydrolase [Escherichia coli]
DGNALAQQIRSDVAARAAALTRIGRTPGLAVILVGDNPASQVYVQHKVKDCEGAGMRSVLEKYDATISQAELLARIQALNED